MKQIISISLLFLFISNSVFKAALIFNYWQNTEEVIAECCINKNKPELECNGKCYIGLQLNKINTNTKEELPGKVMQKDFELFMTPKFTYSAQLYAMDIPVFENTSDDYNLGYASEVFQPPTA